MKPFLLVFAALAAAALELCAQSFEVASIRRHVLPAGQSVYRMLNRTGFGGTIAGNRVTEEVCSLTDLILDAYDVKEYQISGAPDWGARGAGYYYDIVAKAEGGEAPPVDRVRRMLQALLADRFQLKLHRETRDLPVYDLVAGKGGPKLKEVAANTPSDRPAPALPPGVLAMRTTIPMLMNLIALQADRPVIDQTGLAGIGEAKKYEYNWPSSFSDASLFTVVQQDLGLILKPDKAPVEMLIVDHAEQPSQN